MIVVQWLPLNEAHIILCWVFSLLFSDLKPRRLRNIPALLMVTLTEFSFLQIPTQMTIYYGDYKTLLFAYTSYINVPVRIWCLIFCIAEDATSSSIWFILFDILTLKVAMLTVFLHVSLVWVLLLIFWTLSSQLQPQQNLSLVNLRERRFGLVVWFESWCVS